MKKYILVVFGGLVLFGSGCADRPLAKPGETLPQEEQNEAVFEPEIPVNEYWDFGKLGERNLYVNNTDKRVVYALDDQGKIVWTIRGEDYGLSEGFEIRLRDEKLFITNRTFDALNGYFVALNVFGPAGSLLWKQTFMGYLDMPEMLIVDRDPKTVVLISGNRNEECDRGCGILCTQEPEKMCDSRATWAFNIETGRILWVNTAKNYYGIYTDLRDDGKIITTSGGIGPGRYGHKYALDPETGTVEEHSAIVSDPGFGESASQMFLVLDENAKSISMQTLRGEDIAWSLSEDSSLYQIFEKHLDEGTVKSAVLDEIIFALEQVDDQRWQSHAFSRSDGRRLWTHDFDSTNFVVSKVKSVDDVLLFSEVFPLPGSEEFPYFTHSEIWAVDEMSGRILWRFREPSRFPAVTKIFAEEGVIQVELGTQELFFLDARTGRRTPFIPPNLFN